MNDASKAAAHELSNVDGVPCCEVVEVVVPACDLQQQHQQKQQQQKQQKDSLQDFEENRKWGDIKAQLKEPIQIKPFKVLVCIDRKQLYKMQAKNEPGGTKPSCANRQGSHHSPHRICPSRLR